MLQLLLIDILRSCRYRDFTFDPQRFNAAQLRTFVDRWVRAGRGSMSIASGMFLKAQSHALLLTQHRVVLQCLACSLLAAGAASLA